jgi:hypothetical protein
MEYGNKRGGVSMRLPAMPSQVANQSCRDTYQCDEDDMLPTLTPNVSQHFYWTAREWRDHSAPIPTYPRRLYPTHADDLRIAKIMLKSLRALFPRLASLPSISHQATVVSIRVGRATVRGKVWGHLGCRGSPWRKADFLHP